MPLTVVRCSFSFLILMVMSLFVFVCCSKGCVATGQTADDMASMLIAHGAHHAINLDGGGKTDPPALRAVVRSCCPITSDHI